MIQSKQQRYRTHRRTDGYSGPAAVCGVKFVPISGFRPGDRGIDFMSSHADQIEVWMVPLPGTALYLPYRISVPTAFGSGSGEMLSFEVGPGQAMRSLRPICLRRGGGLIEANALP